MEICNKTLYKTFYYKLTDTYDIVHIDDLGRQTVVDSSKEPRFRPTICDVYAKYMRIYNYKIPMLNGLLVYAKHMLNIYIK